MVDILIFIGGLSLLGAIINLIYSGPVLPFLLVGLVLIFIAIIISTNKNEKEKQELKQEVNKLKETTANKDNNKPSNLLDSSIKELVDVMINSIENIETAGNGKNSPIVNRSIYHILDFATYILFNLYVIAQSHIHGPTAHKFFLNASTYAKNYFLIKGINPKLLEKFFNMRITTYNQTMINLKSLEKANSSLLDSLYQFFLKDEKNDYFQEELIVENILSITEKKQEIVNAYDEVIQHLKESFMNIMEIYKHPPINI